MTAVRVGIAPADRPSGLGRDPPADREPAAGQDELAPASCFGETGVPDPLKAAEPVPAAGQLDEAVRDPRAGPAGDPDPGECHVEQGFGCLGEAVAMQPDPSLRVFRSPVVADHAGPLVDGEAVSGDLDVAGQPHGRVEALRLGPRHGRPVHPGALQVRERRRLAGEGQLPRRPPCGFGGQPPVAQPEVVARRSGGLREAGLPGQRARQGGVEEGAPEAADRPRRRRLPYGVADPGRLSTRRPGCLQVEALVVPSPRRHGREPRVRARGGHGRTLPAGSVDRPPARRVPWPDEPAARRS